MTIMLGSYRALVIVEAGSLGRQIIKQLQLSPLCREIFYQGPALQLPTPANKLRDFSEIGESQVDLAFFGDSEEQGRTVFLETASKARVGHLTILSSSRAPLKLVPVNKFRRLSVFSPSFILQTEPSSFLDRLRNSAYPIASQFLPSKFREISVEDLALAMRLNAELCAPSPVGPCGQTVEWLRFPECMQIIGRDDRI